MTRVKYDLLPEGMHSYVYVDDPGVMDPVDGMCAAAAIKEVKRNDIVEVEDLNDPKSRRAVHVRQHIEGIGKPGQSGSQPPIATVLTEEEKPQKGATKGAAAKPAEVKG